MTVEIPEKIELRPNPHGGYIIRQSDLGSWAYCQLQKFYKERAVLDPNAPQPEQLSASVYGSVMHYALMLLEQMHHEGRNDALDVAVKTFEHYWHPDNVEQVAARVTEWLPRQTYGGLRERGRRALRDYYKILCKDDGKLLALEYQFAVPIRVNGRTHTLTGTLDKLVVRFSYSKPYISVEDYKGLAFDTPLPTPTGWTTMGAVQVGDHVLGADGQPVTVTAKSVLHDRPCFRLTFDDTSSIVADDQHLWQVHVGQVPRDVDRRVASTREIAQLLADGELVRILNAAPLALPQQVDLPIDPYVLGAWLGDGHHMRGVITKPDQELYDLIASRGYKVGVPQVDRRTGCQSRTVLGLQTQLRAAGLQGHKHIPDLYLRAGYTQRLALLRGLMDTDGCWNRGRRRAVFATTDKRLAEGVRELVVSLGWKATVFTVKRQGFGLTVTAYDVCFTPVDANPFSLSRKADLVDTLDVSRWQRPRRRLITSCVETIRVPTQCIQVDAEDCMYLAGEQMVPTHNTGRQPTYLRYNQQGSAYCYATTREEFWRGWVESGMPMFETFDVDTVAMLERLFDAHRFRMHHRHLVDHVESSRRFRWVNLQELKNVDGGWRNERDYARLKIALDAYVRANEAGIYSPTNTGEVCVYCAFKSVCGGVALPDPEYGALRP